MSKIYLHNQYNRKLILNNYVSIDRWFLPSVDELLLMYNNLKIDNVGNFQNSEYWSSSTLNDIDTFYWGFIVDFSTGGSGLEDKSESNYVRACKSFSLIEVSPSYNLKDIGPNGGYIFYVHDNENGSYSYLECAQNDISGTHILSDNVFSTTQTDIGMGLLNTISITNNATEGAAHVCYNLGYKQIFKRLRLIESDI